MLQYNDGNSYDNNRDNIDGDTNSVTDDHNDDNKWYNIENDDINHLIY